MLGAKPQAPKDGVACIVAATAQMGIGRDGTLPWRLKGDMAYFKRVTTEAPAAQQNAVVMGRKTWLSIPKKFRPLPGRANVVLSRNPDAREQLDLPEDVACYASLDTALTQMKSREDVAKVFVIGGGELYKAASATQGARKSCLLESRTRRVSYLNVTPSSPISPGRALRR